MANTGEVVGVNYPTLMPDLTDIADVQQAFLMYHLGYANWNGIDPPANNSIEGHIGTIDTRLDVLEALPISRGVYSSTAPTIIPGTSTPIPAGYIWVDSDNNRLSIYSGTAWEEVTSSVNTAANYSWSGTHSYSNSVTITNALTAAYKFNSFLNPAARTSAITSPQTGLISFIQQDAVGNTVNKFQYYNGSAWTDLNTVSYSSSSPASPSTGNIWVDSDTNQMYVYTGSSWTLISGGTGSGGSIETFFLMGA